jgi:hypothetical protein
MYASLASPQPVGVEAARHLMAKYRVEVHRQIRDLLARLAPGSSKSKFVNFARYQIMHEPRDRK